MTETEITCPFCGEPITLLVDTSVDQQTYVEDCSVCCRPILLNIGCVDDELRSLAVDRSS